MPELFGLTLRVPRGGDERTVRGGSRLFDIFRTVEAVIADDHLSHAHVAGLLGDERPFLIEAGHADDVRIGCLDLRELRGEIRVLLGEGLRRYHIDAHFLEEILIDAVSPTIWSLLLQ